MSYRNDHDAAVARVDALQHEVQRLADENSQLRDASSKRPATVRHSGTAGWVVGAGIVALIAGGFLGIAAGSASNEAAPEQPTPRELESRRALETCLGAIQPRPAVENPRTSVDVAAVELTAAPCHLDLRDFARRAALSPSERETLDELADAEAELGNRISMMAVYYTSDPLTLDSYATASQLWNEYDRALAARNAVIDRWRAHH